jgi:hypothetical protein
MNPIQDGRDRSILDRRLRDVSASGVFVRTHPDVILKMGTKEVLYHTRHMGWGCDTHLYRSMEQMRRELPRRLAAGRARVLKCKINVNSVAPFPESVPPYIAQTTLARIRAVS